MPKFLFQLLLPALILTACVSQKVFQTARLYRFTSEMDEGTAALLFYDEQLIDTMSLNYLQTTPVSAVYIKFHKYEREPLSDIGDTVYGGEGNYKVFHRGRIISTRSLPRLSPFSSPVLAGDYLVYWGFINGSAYGFRTDLNTLNSDSVRINSEIISTDFRYAYYFPSQREGLWLFKTRLDSALINFETLEKIELD